MHPFQYKMSTGAIYVGFPDSVDGYGMFKLNGACIMTYVASESRYDIRNLFSSYAPVEINQSCVQARQEISPTSDSALAYCRYVGTMIAVMKDEGVDPLPHFLEYIGEMDDYFRTQFDGVGIELSGAYDYSQLCGDVKEIDKIREKMLRESRDYKKGSLTTEDKSCQPNVVHLQFGSNRNAPEKGED